MYRQNLLTLFQAIFAEEHRKAFEEKANIAVGLSDRVFYVF
jgi:hypothetical protein